jgi:hypothetical protein
MDEEDYDGLVDLGVEAILSSGGPPKLWHFILLLALIGLVLFLQNNGF